MSQKPTWEKPGQDEKRLRRQLMQALSRSGVCVTLQDETSDYLFVANFLDGWTLVPGDSPDDSSLFGPKLGKELTELKTTVRETGASAEMESRVGSDRYFRFVVDPVSTEADGTDLVTTIIEISKDRKSESVRRSLLREVSHRSKNLLAIIQSIASQTARHSDTIEQFLNKFRGRLYSLSLSQDLVTDSLWRGAYLRELVDEQVQRYVPDGADLIVVEGDNALLSPNAALHIGLALHELIINALTHGVLGKDEAGVTISCVEHRVGETRMIEFTWTEELPEADATPARAVPAPRFGSAVLERVLPASVNGEAQYEIGERHVTYKLAFPSDVEPA